MAVSLRRAVATLFSILLILDLISFSVTSTDFKNLVFKGCANQKFSEPSAASKQTLKSLLDSLVSHSSSQTFYNTSANMGASISGLFQCRGDLTNPQCSECVSEAQNLATKLCKSTISARIQLIGCYLKYLLTDFEDASGVQFLYKVCSPNRNPIPGFDGMQATALGMIASGLSNGNIFYTGSYQSFYVLGQCEATLSPADCGNCANSAIAIAKSQCGEAASAEIYLNRCFVSYTYFNGKGHQGAADSPGSSERTQRTVAIVVGGVVVIGFLIILLFSLKSWLKRRLSKLDDW